MRPAYDQQHTPKRNQSTTSSIQSQPEDEQNQETSGPPTGPPTIVNADNTVRTRCGRTSKPVQRLDL